MRLLLTISLFLLTISAFSQTGNFDYLTANRRFTLAGRTVKGISNDTALLTASADSLVTQYAIRGYIDQRLLNTPDSSYIFDPEQFIVNGWNVSIRFPQDPGEPLFTGSPAYNLTQAHIDFLDSLMLALRDSNYTYFDDRDFYNDGTAALPFRIVRYDNHYIDSLFASVSSGGGGGGGGSSGPYHLPYNADTSYYLGGDSALHKLQTVASNGSYHLPYNNDSTYVLAGDSTLHKLPTYTPFDSTSISSRINQKQNKLKLTTLGQTGASTLINDTLNIPNYFFATNDSTDYSFSSMTAIYSEAGPGEATIGSSGVTANKDNLNFPFKQLKALDVGGWNAGDYVSFSWPTAKNSTSYTFLRGFVRLKQAVPIIQSLSFQFFNAGVAVSQILSMVNYGLDKSKVDVYQNITIPMSAFGFNTNGFDEIRLIFGGGSSASGLYLDLFQFQNATVEENKYLTDAFRSPGTLNVYGILGGQNKLLFTDSIGTPVDTQYLRRDININTTAIAGKENAITASNTAGKYWNGYKQFVTLNTDSVTEATNKYYTDTRARAALTLTTNDDTAATYNNTTGRFNIPKSLKRFGIEDNASTVDRGVDMGLHDLEIFNASQVRIFAENGPSGSYGTISAMHGGVVFQASDGTGNNSDFSIVGESVSYTHNAAKVIFPNGVVNETRFLPLTVNGIPADSTGNINTTGSGSSSGVTSFNSRTGAVTPQSADYSSYYAALSHTHTSSQITDFSSAARALISVTGNGTYNSTTGVINIGTSASVGTITWLGTAYNINSGNNITLATPTTSNISEGSNLYYTDARARAAISVTGSGTYDNTTGVINITGGSSSGWALGGNTLTNSGTQYIGTNNLTSFRVRTNLVQRLLVDSLGDTRLDGSNTGAYALGVYGANTLRFGVTGFGGVTTNGGTLTIGSNTSLASTRLNINYTATNAGVAVKNTAVGNYSILAQSSGATTNLAIGDSGLIIKSAAISFPLNNTVVGTNTLTIGSQDYTVNVDATSANKTIVLPTAAFSSGSAGTQNVTGRVYIIRKADATANAITINTTNSQTINGASSYVLSAQYQYVIVQSDGSNWMIIGKT